MKRILSTAVLGFFASASALAADGYLTGDVNLRAGPDPGYPSVAMLSAGTEVAIQGCVDGWSWCDVAAGDNRGWVAGNFLQEEYQGQRVLVPEYGVQIGIPIVSFVFGTYWDDHYRNRSWYGNRAQWSHVRPQYRPVAGGGSSGSRGAAPSPRTAVESKPSAAVTTQPSYQGRPASTAIPQRPAATEVRSQETTANHANPTERNTAAPKAEAAKAAERAAPAPKPMAEHNAVAPRPETSRAPTEHAAPPKAMPEHQAAAPKAQQKEAPAKAAPERENGKDNKDNKDQH